MEYFSFSRAVGYLPRPPGSTGWQISAPGYAVAKAGAAAKPAAKIVYRDSRIGGFLDRYRTDQLLSRGAWGGLVWREGASLFPQLVERPTGANGKGGIRGSKVARGDWPAGKLISC